MDKNESLRARRALPADRQMRIVLLIAAAALALIVLLDQAGAQYRAAVLTAFQNVADALTALALDADAVAAGVRAEHAAADSLAATRRNVELGSVSYRSLLSSQQADAQALLNLTQARANRYADTAALFQALGGGWRNRDRH